MINPKRMISEQQISRMGKSEICT